MIGSFLGPNRAKTLKVGPTAAMSDAMAKLIFLKNYFFLNSFI